MFSSDSDSDLEILTILSDLDSSSSDEDETEEPSPSRRKVVSVNTAPSRRTLNSVNSISSRHKLKRVHYMQCLNDADFMFRFRMNKTGVNTLLKEIMPAVRVTSARNNGVPPLHQLLVTLRYFALGTMLTSIAESVGVSKSTATRIVRDISKAICSLYDKYIVLHTRSINKFYKIAKFPGVIGCIDCIHVRIQLPRNVTEEKFRNRKKYFSINTQAVCDADLNFMNVIAEWPGSTHDATIFENSVLKEQCDTDIFDDCWLLGDNAYQNSQYLLTPVVNPVTEEQLRYNEAHHKTRNTIQRAFEAWKRRFPVIAFTLRLSLPNTQAVIMATAVLYNICRVMKISNIPPEVDLPLQEDIDDNSLLTIDSDNDEVRNDVINKCFQA